MTSGPKAATSRKRRRTVPRFGAGSLHPGLAGGDDSDDESIVDDTAAPTAAAAGEAGKDISTALSALAQASEYRDDTGNTFVIHQLPLTRVAPHPWNPASRSKAHPRNPAWQRFVRSLRTRGQDTPALVVTRAAWLRARPHLAHVVEDADYVLVYGHRRRIGLIEADREFLRAVVDDSVLEGDQDLDAMNAENSERENLSLVEQAQQWAVYSIELGLTQEQIGERVNNHQSTVKRRLALNLLTPEAQAALDAYERRDRGDLEDEEANELAKFTANDANVVATKLPWGPKMPWQKSSDPDQDSDLRREEQNRVLELIIEGWIARRAVDRVLAERRSRQMAAQGGLDIVDPADRFGDTAAEHRIFLQVGADEAQKQGLLGAIDPDTGALAYYSPDPVPAADPADTAPADEDNSPTEHPGESGDGEKQHPEDAAESDAQPERRKPKADPDAKERQAATKARRMAAAKVAITAPGKTVLSDLIVSQYARGVVVDKNARELAHQWARAGELTSTATPAEWQAEATVPTLAWAVAVAAAELNAAGGRDWSHADVDYLDLLKSRGGYEPSLWEQRQIHDARQRTIK